MSSFDGFEPSRGGAFRVRRGPSAPEARCAHKLCFAATDRQRLLTLLAGLANHPACCFVKISEEPVDGMFVGRCVMSDPTEVGRLWRKWRRRGVLCTVQDDHFLGPFRTRSEPPS